jgi:hypothetical protein
MALWSAPMNVLDSTRAGAIIETLLARADEHLGRDQTEIRSDDVINQFVRLNRGAAERVA